jgi:hypothetical protein
MLTISTSGVLWDKVGHVPNAIADYNPATFAAVVCIHIFQRKGPNSRHGRKYCATDALSKPLEQKTKTSIFEIILKLHRNIFAVFELLLHFRDGRRAPDNSRSDVSSLLVAAAEWVLPRSSLGLLTGSHAGTSGAPRALVFLFRRCLWA